VPHQLAGADGYPLDGSAAAAFEDHTSVGNGRGHEGPVAK
jgi:hypothetical protein